MAPPYSALAGVVAAAGSAIGKFATSADSAAVAAVASGCEALLGGGPHGPSAACSGAALAARGALLAALIASNTAAIALHLKGMSQVGSFMATLLNTGANFLVTALLGWAVFGESLPLAWWAGGALIALGTVLVASAAGGTAAAARAPEAGGEGGDSGKGAAGGEAAGTAGGVRQRRGRAAVAGGR